MKKINFSKLGIQVIFSPVVDRQFDVIAYEAIMPTVDKFPQLATKLTFPAYESVQHQLNEYYKTTALETYKGTVPLILCSGFWNSPYPDSLPEPRSFDIIITLEQVWLDEPLEPIKQFANKGVHFALGKFGYCILSLPLLSECATEVYHISTGVYRTQQSE